MELRNIKRVATLILLTGLLQLGTIYSVVISINLFQKDKKKILVIGNRHARGEPEQIIEQDKLDSAVVFDWIQKLDSNICFLLEGTDYQTKFFKELKTSNNSYLGLCIELPIWAQDNNFKYKNLKFILVDPRTIKLKALGKAYIQATKLAENKVSKQAQAKYKLAIKKDCVVDITISQWLQEVEAIKSALDSKFKKIKEKLLVIEQKSIEKFFTALSGQQKNCQQFLEQYDQNQGVPPKSAIDLIIESPGQFTDFFDVLFQPLACCIAELGFILELQEVLQDQDNVVIYCGNNHTININSYLKFLGYNQVFSKGMCTLRQDAGYSGKIINKELETLLNIAFKGQAPQPEKQEEQKEKLCANGCGKNGPLLCGRCKQVNYCSQACQRAHWKTHKPECKTVESKK